MFLLFAGKASDAAQSAYYDPNRPQCAYVPPPSYYVSTFFLNQFMIFMYIFCTDICIFFFVGTSTILSNEWRQKNTVIVKLACPFHSIIFFLLFYTRTYYNQYHKFTCHNDYILCMLLSFQFLHHFQYFLYRL